MSDQDSLFAKIKALESKVQALEAKAIADRKEINNNNKKSWSLFFNSNAFSWLNQQAEESIAQKNMEEERREKIIARKKQFFH